MAKKMSFLKRIKQDLEMDREMCHKQREYFQNQINQADVDIAKLNKDIDEIVEMMQKEGQLV